MDKRSFIGEREYLRKDGTTFKAKIYHKNNNNGITVRVVYGEMELYVSSYTTMSHLDEVVNRVALKYSDRILNRPFMKEGIYAYVLGKKRYFTNDVSLKDSDTFFYVPKTVKDPLTTYKKDFLAYIKPRVIALGTRMGVDLSLWKIRTGLFLTYYGVCFPTKHQLKFDYRLFAYQPAISDAIIYHEIAHTFDIHHDDRFYAIVKTYCPDYDALDEDIQAGRFEGRLDHYVLSDH
jgi:predicted metal-dependent hydrolase